MSLRRPRPRAPSAPAPLPGIGPWDEAHDGLNVHRGFVVIERLGLEVATVDAYARDAVVQVVAAAEEGDVAVEKSAPPATTATVTPRR